MKDMNMIPQLSDIETKLAEQAAQQLIQLNAWDYLNVDQAIERLRAQNPLYEDMEADALKRCFLAYLKAILESIETDPNWWVSHECSREWNRSIDKELIDSLEIPEDWADS